MKRLVIYFSGLLSLCGTACAQREARPEFEAASLKPSQQPAGSRQGTACRGGPGTNDPSLFTCENTSLSQLVIIAHHIPYERFSAPDWMATTRFDLMARVPEGTTKEQFTVMMQNLLADRFRLVLRHQSKDLPKYDLVVAKNGPKFMDYLPPIGQTQQVPAPPAPITLAKDGYPALRGKLTLAVVSGHARMHLMGATMELFAAQLSSLMKAPVADLTGLTGKYEISLFWISESVPPAAAPGVGGIPSTTDPGPTLMQALQDQLGLRLEGKKGPVDVVVVEHAERFPVAN
jgi:uncharacterized protein (TIGR03435 family)